MEICELKNSDEKAWDEYVLKHPDSTFYHQIGWKNVVEKSYGHKPYYLLAKEDGEIKGILPCIFIENRILGKKLVSVPFGPYGGPCADNEFIEQALINELKKLTNKLNAKSLEIRTNPFKKIDDNDLINNVTRVTSILELNKDSDIVLMDKLNRNKRKTIYKSQKMELSYKWTCETDDFYNLFVRNMSDLGSPAHSKDFFDNIILEFSNSAKVLVVQRQNKVIYASFNLFYKDTMINSWSSTLRIYRQYYPTDFGIWNAIQYGCEKGYSFYDFGRSRLDSTNQEFKRRWGTEEKELYYYLYQSKNKRLLSKGKFQLSGKESLFPKIWKKIPNQVAKKIGPLLRKDIP